MPNIEFIPLDLVDDYDKNSNTHPQAQIENIKALMLYVGWTVPALVRKTGERYGLIAGHGRREAANELQGKPLKMADGTPIPAGCIPVLFADGWTEEQIRAYVIADNQVPRQSIFDESILAEELQALQDGGLDLGMIGFDGLMNTNIIIRTLIYTQDHIYLSAGGGIVADSTVETELMETKIKIQKIFDSFEPQDEEYQKAA